MELDVETGDGVKSFEDPNLLKDKRVLENILFEDNNNVSTRKKYK